MRKRSFAGLTLKTSTIAVNTAGVRQAVPVTDLGTTIIGAWVIIGIGQAVITRQRCRARKQRRADQWRYVGYGPVRRREKQVPLLLDIDPAAMDRRRLIVDARARGVTRIRQVGRH